MEHTPTPWIVRDFNTTYEVRSDDGLHIVSTSWQDTIRHPYPLKNEAAANVAFIVQACNAHDRLVAALDAILRRATPHELDTPEDRERDMLHIEHTARMALIPLGKAQ